MPRLSLSLPLVLSGLFLALIIALNFPFSVPEQKASGASSDIMGRAEYELTLLKDPETGKIPAGVRKMELEYANTLPNDLSQQARVSGLPPVWSPRGPWNVGGRTRGFCIDASNENVFLAGTCAGGIWKSQNQGQTWTRVTGNNHAYAVSALIQDKRAGHTSKWYYATGEGYGASPSGTGAYYLGNGIYKSTDGGNTWNSLSVTATNTPHSFESGWDIIWNLAMDYSNTTQDEIYAARYGGISRSVDGGQTWATVRGGNPNCYFSDVAVNSNGVVYATMSDDGIHKGIWRSPDGTTWTKINPPGFPASYRRLVIGIAPGDENQVWFLGYTPGFGQPDTNFVGNVEWNSLWKYKYLSGNGDSAGGYWEDHSQFLPTTGGPFEKLSSQGSHHLVVKVHPTDTNIVFIGGTNLYRSDDGFSSLNNTAFIGGYQQGASLPIVNMYQDHHPDQHVLEFLPSNNQVMFCANDGGIFRTNNSLASQVSWIPLNNGYLTSMFYTVAIDHATPGNQVIVGGTQDNGSWFTNNNNLTSPWSTPRGGDGSYCAIADNRSMYYLSIQNGKMMKADLDANGNVLQYARIDPIGGTGYLFINPYTLDPNNNHKMYLAAGKYLWRNDSLGGIPLINNWDTISTNWVRFTDSVSQVNTKISSVHACKAPANRVYFGTTSRKLYRIDNAHVGNPTKTDITSTSTTSAFPNGNISCIATNPNNGDEMLVTFSNYNVKSIFYHSGGGLPTNAWVDVGGNLDGSGGSGPSVRWAAIIPVSDGKIYMVATSTGVYATDTLMGSNTIWVQQATSTIGNAICTMIDYRLSDGLVVVATHSFGVYSTHLTAVSDIVSVSPRGKDIPGEEISVFPNPVFEKLNLEIRLANSETGKVRIWSLRGELVFESGKEQLVPGVNSRVFSIPVLSPGVYMLDWNGRISRKILVSGSH